MKVGFKNLRSLVDTGDLEIKPITILLGQNSSGKSTFIRTFPLLKQSLEARTTGPILWYGRFVDFGDFSNALNDFAKDKFIEFSYDIGFHHGIRTKYGIIRRSPFYTHIRKITDCRVSLQLKGGKEGKTSTSKIELQFNGFHVELYVGKNDNLDRIVVDGRAIKLDDVAVFNLGNSFIPHVIFKHEKGHYTLNSERFLIRMIYDQIRTISKRNLTDNTISKIISKLNFSSNESLFHSITEQTIVKGFHNRVNTWEIGTAAYGELKTLFISSLVPSLIEKCDQFIGLLAKNTSYIAPLRAIAERYYRPQDLNVEEVDFQGKNLALVLRNLSISEKSEFENWCLDTFGFHPRAKVLGGNMTVNVIFKNDRSEHNIADLGFGFSQILPIITQMWVGVIKNKNNRFREEFQIKLYAIEQPELHLHPKVQAMLVDAIINVINFCHENEMFVYFILETHSETIINTIGTRIFRQKISPSEVNVIMFEKEPNLPVSRVSEVKYNTDGTLENWPYGFFEEDFESL